MSGGGVTISVEQMGPVNPSGNLLPAGSNRGRGVGCARRVGMRGAWSNAATVYEFCGDADVAAFARGRFGDELPAPPLDDESLGGPQAGGTLADRSVSAPPASASRSPTLCCTPSVIVYALVDDRDDPGHPLGDTVDVYLRRDDAEQDLAGIVDDEPGWAPYFSVLEVELVTGCSN